MTDQSVNGQCADKDQSKDNAVSTILDWLNEDCWKLVLDYVPVEDIIKSKKVSQQWYRVVHRYLEEMGVCIETYQYVAHGQVFDIKVLPKNRIADLDMTPGYLPYCKDYVTMEDFWREWGPYTVYTYCETKPELDVIAQYCPKLKALLIRLRDFGVGPLSEKQVKLCEKLERLVLMPYGKYDNLKFFNICDVKKEGHRNARRYIVSREFCSNLKPTRLKSLTICGRFNYRYFFADVTFPELTVLNLQGCHRNISMLLQKMPKLERLRLMGDDQIKLDRKVPGLKHLTVLFYGDFIEDMVTNCCDLQTLELVGHYHQMVDILSALSRVQNRTLSVSCSLCYSEGYPLSDDEVLKLIRAYPDLTKLDIRQYTGFTTEFLPRVARAARQLRILVHSEVASLAQDQQIQYPGLIVEAYPPDEEWDPIPIQYIGGMS